MASQFSKDGQYFAHLSVDGKLKIWHTATSKLEQEFTPDFHLTSPCTCLQFIQPTNSTRKSGSPRKKLKRRDSAEVLSPYIVIGTTSGLLLVYSITKADLDFTIDSETSQSINCLSWQRGTVVHSAAEQTVLSWDLQKKSIKSKWKAGNEKITSILLLPDVDHLLTASRNIKLWHLETKELLRTFTGHSSEVSILEYVDPGKSGAYFISGSKADRILSCWNVNDDSKNAVASFLMEDVATLVTVSNDSDSSTKLAAVTRSGVCHVYQHTLNGKGSKPLKPKKTIKVAADATDSKTRVTPIPIVASQFLDDATLMITHGTAVLLIFENVVPNAHEKVQCLIRKDPRVILKQQESAVSKTKTPLADNNVHYLTPHTTNTATKRKSGTTAEVPMEKRLENLTLNKLDGTSGVPKANNLAQLLLQGLHSKDKGILGSVLSNRDETVIENTVRRLPMAVIVPLVQELTGYIQGKTMHCQVGSLWLKCVLQTHVGLLVSNPELSDILGPVLGSIDSRLSLQAPLSRLRGRLDLLVSQVNLSKTPNNSAEDEALLVYNDKASSDSETEMLELGAHSESENEWLESEDGVDENRDDNNSDEEMST